MCLEQNEYRREENIKLIKGKLVGSGRAFQLSPKWARKPFKGFRRSMMNLIYVL